MRHKSEKWIRVLIRGKVVEWDEDGKPARMTGTHLDITKRKQAEEELWVKDSAIASSINAIALADLEGNLTYVNLSFLKLWGYDDNKEVLGKPITGFWQLKEKAAEVVEALREGESWKGDLVARGKDGSLFDDQLSANIGTDKADKPVCIRHISWRYCT